MTSSFRVGRSVLVGVLLASGAAAQTASNAPAEATRPAFGTAQGDTGLWYVPTAEVLAKGRWSASGYRTSVNFTPGFSNVANFPLNFGVGVFRGAEFFASFSPVSRIDRDLRPLFLASSASPEVGGPIPANPYASKTWSGSKRGDALVGLKISLLSEERQKPVALAVRGSVKLPTGDKDAGISTGKADSFLDVIVSKDVMHAAEISGYAGGVFRSSTDEISQSKGLRWGVGAGFPSHFPLRLTAELYGEKPSDDAMVLSTPIVGADNSRASGSYPLKSSNAATLGLTWQTPRGVFFGFGVTKSFSAKSRTGFTTDSDPVGDFVDYQIRIGYHPGAPRYVAPPPPPLPAPPPPSPPPAPVNRAPTLGGAAGAAGAQPPITVTKDGAPCNPCTIEPGQTITLSANGTDADGDTLTYRWTAPTGTFSNPTGRTTDFTAPPNFEGSIPVTVTADDGKGGTTSATTIVQVAKRPVVELNFEDVYFDFDRSTLRPEALRLLDDAVAKLMANPDKNLIIEGHTCNIGTAEYNLALGERRARGVYNYLTSRGVPAGRLETRSYGEEEPKFDNSREETRRLNRRAALVVKVQ